MYVFDWDKAALLIKESGCSFAEAGLREDWFHTGGTIFDNGKPVYDQYTFLESAWATPVLCMNGETIDCYRDSSDAPEWDAKTKWPKSALMILGIMMEGELLK